jgi:hypothetical protein
MKSMRRRAVSGNVPPGLPAPSLPHATATQPGQLPLPEAFPAWRAGADMAAPSWLAVTFAAIMILTAAYSASRVAFSRLRGRATELDADALHTVMGVAMAGMLVPWLHVMPGSVWAAVFGIGAAWFGWHALGTRSPVSPRLSRCRYPVPHLVECAAMLYMLLPGHRPAHGVPGMAMPGMSAFPSQGFPALAVILALFMLGYIVWTTDRLTSRTAQPSATAAAPGGARDHRPPVTAIAGTRANDPASIPGPGDQAGKPALAPKLAACTKIAMSLTMGYMLILML